MTYPYVSGSQILSVTSLNCKSLRFLSLAIILKNRMLESSISLLYIFSMLPFLKKKEQATEPKNVFTVLDIGTDWVKVLIVETDRKMGKIVGVGKQRQKLGDMHKGSIIDIGNVTENCREALQEAEKMADKTPRDLIIGIAGELVQGVSTNLEYVRKDYFEEITMAELQNIVHKVQWRAFDDIRQEIKQEAGLNELDVKLIHSAIVGVDIDGYKVSNPLGFKGRNVKITVFNVFAPLIHFESIQTIAANLEKELISIASEPYAVCRSLGFEDGSDISAIFVDIGGGTTDVAIVINGGVVMTKMFGLGGRIFTKRLAKHENISFLEAEQRKILFSQSKLPKKEQQLIETLFEADVEIWIESLLYVLEQASHEIEVLPNKILLCGGGALLPSIEKGLNAYDWEQVTFFAQKPRISYLHPKDIINLQDTTSHIKNIQDVTPMALGNLALELAGDEALLPRMLKKAIRLVEK